MIETKKMNAVVNERSTEDEVDINARHNTVLQDIVGQLNEQKENDHLRTERGEVKTGNAMIDQFVPWYFGVAFASCLRIMQVFLICRSLHGSRGTDAPTMLLALKQAHG